jgi:type II secretory pathway pseudopilin PulG
MADMKIRRFAPGFTVIELMLFLSITGALFIALMFGVNTNITQQRYREGVQSYAALIQDQYSQVANTHNDNNNDWTCAPDGQVKPASNGGTPRGTSQCVLLGKAIQIQEPAIIGDGSVINIYNVVGCEPRIANDIPQNSQNGGNTGGTDGCSNATILTTKDTSDISTLVHYNPKVTDFSKLQESMDWGLELKPKDKQALGASFLILRSPASGLIRIFALDNKLPSDLATMITAPTATTVVKNCVAGERGLLPYQSVSVDPKISGPSSVVINENDEACNE